MMTVVDSFIYCIITLYTVYQYIISRNSLWGELAILHLLWFLVQHFYIVSLFYAGSTLQAKVRPSLHRSCSKRHSIFVSFLLKAKEIAIISHRIINSCSNMHINSAVIIKYIMNFNCNDNI